MVEDKKIGIVCLCTNGYFPLGIRFVKRFMQFYKGERKIKFFLFTNTDPKEYLPENIDYKYTYVTNDNWVDGTNLKFSSILSLEGNVDDISHLYFFDGDTNIGREFTEEWFLGESVSGQHFADQSWMKDKKGFERNPRSKAYIPLNTTLPQCYMYGAFFGGSTEFMFKFCKTMVEWQKADKSWGYEPSVNDESFLNAYFHYNPPTKLVATKDFAFGISDKGGLQNMRDVNLNVEKLKNDLKAYKNDNIEILNGKVVVC